MAVARTCLGRPAEGARRTEGAQRSDSWAMSTVRQAAAGPDVGNAAQAGLASAGRSLGSRVRAARRGAQALAVDASVATRPGRPECHLRMRYQARQVGDSTSALRSQAQRLTLRTQGRSHRQKWRTRDGACVNVVHCSTRHRRRSRHCLHRPFQKHLRSQSRVHQGRWARQTEGRHDAGGLRWGSSGREAGRRASKRGECRAAR